MIQSDGWLSEPIRVFIAGNIGSGKTTLCKLLQDSLGWEAYLEHPGENPFLEKFYSDMVRWSFLSQAWFITTRVHQIEQACKNHEVEVVIFDRTIYEDSLFALNLYEIGALSPDEYQTYINLFQIYAARVPPPDVLIYLRASVSTLVAHIAKRSRHYEREISQEYLHRMSCYYESWIAQYELSPLVDIDMDKIDFVERGSDLKLIISQLQDVKHIT